MTSPARIRLSLRRAAFVAALSALMIPATAGASANAHASKKKKAKAPVVTSVAPMKLQIGQTLEIRGRSFLRGRNRNTVVFKRSGGKAVFVKAIIGTTKLLRVTVPAKLGPELNKSGGSSVATRFRIRVLAKKFGKRFTSASRSPLVSPAPLPGTTGLVMGPNGVLVPGGAPAPSISVTEPDGDCDSDGILNQADSDDDGDMLPDTLETKIGTDPCKADTDADGVQDGYEYRSAIDLNNDEYQDPNVSLPYPGKRPYPNPLFKDANTDYDGDSLTLAEEQALWIYTSKEPGETLSLDHLYYSDGMKYSIYRHVSGGGDRREPALSAVGYDKQIAFETYLNGDANHPPSGYANVYLSNAPQGVYAILDVNRDHTVSPAERYYLDTGGSPNHQPDGYLSDDERDEDADGLSNYDETHGRMVPDYWTGKYTRETPFHISYAGTDPADRDSDGDKVPDGADDQDHDDIPNIMELSRQNATGRTIDEPDTDVAAGVSTPAFGRVDPFSPCLPDPNSRTCPTYIPLGGGAWAPFDGSDLGGNDPDYLVLQ